MNQTSIHTAKIMLISLCFAAFSLTGGAASFAELTDTVTKAQTDTVKARTNGVNLDSLERAADKIELGTVTVTAEQRQMNAGTESFLVTNEMRKGTISASQMLNNVPGIAVDLTSETVNVGLDKDVMILVNGQEVAPEFARSINPKRIRTVEIQRYPAGKFSNVPVLVNLVLKEDYEGWDISARAYGAAGMRTPHPANGSGSVNFIYSLNKWDFNFSAKTNGSRSYGASSFSRKILDKITESTPVANWKDPNMKMHGKGTTVFAATKYRIDKKNTLTFELNSQIKSHRNNQHDEVSVITPDKQFSRVENTNLKYTNDEYSAKIGYMGQYTGKSAFGADLTYDFYRVNDNSVFSQDNDPVSSSYTKGKKNFVSFFAGGYQAFNDKMFMQLNTRATWRDYKNRYADKQDDFFTSEELRDQTDIRFSWRPKNELQFVAGGSLYMLKQTQNRHGEKSKQTHIDPVPYFYGFWKFHKDWWINGTYYSEVQYPVLDNLSPNVVQTGDYMWKQGNPSLRSSILQYVTSMLDYKGKLRLHYIWVANRHERSDYYSVFDDGVMQTMVNGKFHHWYLGLEGNFNLPHNMRWTFRAFHQRKSREYADLGTRKGKVWYLETELSYFHRPSGLALVGNYYFGQQNEPLLQGINKQPIDHLKLTAQKMFLKNRLTAAMSVQFPVRMGHRLNTTAIDIPGFQSHYAYDPRIRNSMVSLNIRVAFGNEKARKLSNSMNLEQEK